MIFIKQLQDQKKENMTICSYLQEYLEGYVPARSPNKVHASDITKEDPEFCPREVVLLRILQKGRKDQYLNQSLKVAFAIGEAYHDLVRDDWLRGVAVGNWKCPHCGHIKEFCKEPKTKCPDCNNPNWRYTEVRFNNPEYGVSGSIDLILDLKMQKLVITEIKSIDKDQFADLVAPLAEHRLRTSLYLRIIAGSDSPHKDKIDLQHSRILYVSKGYGKKDENGKFTPFKEYIIDRNDDANQVYVDKALAIRMFETDGVFPSGVCPTSFVKRVKACRCSKECFSHYYPAGKSLTVPK